MKSLSHFRLFAAPWIVAYQAPPSMGFSRQECWSGLPFPSPGDLPDPGIEPGSPTLQADALSKADNDKPITGRKKKGREGHRKGRRKEIITNYDKCHEKKIIQGVASAFKMFLNL